MSKTFKDMPWEIQAAYRQGIKVPATWRRDWDWCFAPNRREYFSYADWLIDLENRGRKMPDYDRGYLQGRTKWPRTTANRRYRKRTNQMVREGRYDEIDRPRRERAWWW